MKGVDKRKLEELIFHYRNSINDSDVDTFVEGASDKKILDFFFSSRTGPRPVYSMDSIDFSGTDFSALGLPAPSARSCVIALRRKLQACGIDPSRHLFIVDRDIEDIVATPHIEGVQLTDAGALPVHLFDNAVEHTFSCLVFNGGISHSTLKKSVNSICLDLYAIRAASAKLSLGLRLLPFSDFVNGAASSGFSLDMLGYVERCLHASSKFSRRSELIEELDIVARTRDQIGGSKFRFINDHDLWEALKSIGAKCAPNNNRSQKDLEEMTMASACAVKLSSHVLFSRVLEKCALGN